MNSKQRRYEKRHPSFTLVKYQHREKWSPTHYYAERDEIIMWLRKNCSKHNYKYVSKFELNLPDIFWVDTFTFKNSEDATLFSLRWM